MLGNKYILRCWWMFPVIFCFCEYRRYVAVCFVIHLPVIVKAVFVEVVLQVLILDMLFV